MEEQLLIEDLRYAVLSQHSFDSLHLAEDETLEHPVVYLELELDALVENAVEPRHLSALRARRLHFVRQEDNQQLNRVADRIGRHCIVPYVLLELLVASFEERPGDVWLLYRL